MNALLPVVDILKRSSVVYPDPRLANYFYVQPHTAAAGTAPVWGGTQFRSMSSGEFLVFLASRISSTDAAVNSLRRSLRGSALPSSWGIPPDDAGILVDVFQAYPNHSNYADKISDQQSAVNPNYGLMSPIEGYRLRAPVDAWGNPILYRLGTFAGDLNQTDLPVGAVARAGTGSVAPTLEYILQDEQLALDMYNANGVPCYGTAALSASDAAREIVRPAIAAYPYAQFISAGPDGVWGAFKDGAAPDFARDARAEAAAARDDNAKDNIYSQESGR